ncbi:MAG: hypothetical protein ACLGIN_04460 [Candidatus Sericytochromatia bacterium]
MSKSLLVLLTLALAAVGCTAVLPPGSQNSPAPAASPGTVSFKTQVVPVLDQHCAACHTAGRGAAAAVEMFDAEGEAKHPVIAARIGDMVQAIESERMPLGKPGSVPAEAIEMLKAWQAAGAPAN